MLILKFGGTSVATASAIRATGEIVRARLHRSPTVVVSALAGVTSELLALATQAGAGHLLSALTGIERIRDRHLTELRTICGITGVTELETAAELSTLCDDVAQLLEALSTVGHVTPRTLDAVAAHGELLAVALVVAIYIAEGLPAIAVDARRVVVTDASFTRAAPVAEAIAASAAEHLLPAVAIGKVPVIGGFIGATKAGVTTTLGRGGSDYSAALIGAALHASAIEIWTDVDGMLTADPRIVGEAQLIDRVRFDEASELATFGAKVLHPRTIVPAVATGIPVSIHNTGRPNGLGTRISAEAPPRPVVAIAGKPRVTTLKIRSPQMLLAPGFLRRVSEVFERHGVSIDVVATSEVSISVTVDGDVGYPFGDVLDALTTDLAVFGEIAVETDMSVIALVGSSLGDSPSIIGRAVASLGDIPLRMLSLSSTGLNLMMVVPTNDFATAMRRLHATFFSAMRAGRPSLDAISENDSAVAAV